MNKKTLVILMFTLGLNLSLSFQAQAAKDDKLFEHGDTTHADHCYKCHTDKLYTRKDRFVLSINALSQQVKRCKDGSDKPWFDGDTEAVVHFLNKRYYKF